MTARLQALGTAMPDHYVFKQSEIVEEFFYAAPGDERLWIGCSSSPVRDPAVVPCGDQ